MLLYSIIDLTKAITLNVNTIRKLQVKMVASVGTGFSENGYIFYGGNYPKWIQIHVITIAEINFRVQQTM